MPITTRSSIDGDNMPNDNNYCEAPENNALLSILKPKRNRDRLAL